MSACEAELCPFWSGTDGCDCAVFDIGDDERRYEQRALGIRTPDSEEDAIEDEFDELPAGAIGRCPVCEAPITPGQPAISSAFAGYYWQHAACHDQDAA